MQDINDHDYAETPGVKKAKSVDEVSQKLEVKMGYCLAYTIVLGIGSWQCSWTANGNTNTTPIFEAKLEWDKDEAILYNTIISTAGMLGITIGSFLGGSILKFGRRRAVIIS